MIVPAYRITLINLASLPSHWGPTLVMLFTMAATVALLTATMAVAVGLANIMDSSARADRAVVLSESVTWVGQSRIDRDQYNAILRAPGVALTPEGEPAVTKDARISVLRPGRSDGVPRAVVVRGYSPTVDVVRPEIRLVSGRLPGSGLDEMIVGRLAQSQFAGTDVGDEVTLVEGRRFRIVGVFESGDWVESGFVTDADTLLAVYGRQSTNAVIVQLTAEDSIGEFVATLKFQVVSEPDYYDRLIEAWGLFERIALTLGWVLGIATFCCVFNVMHAAVTARAAEIATYRALGFGQTSVVLAVVAEALAIALAGAAVGIGASYLVFDGNFVTAGARDASVVHVLAVSPEVIGIGVAFACVVTLAGCLGPALRVVRMPVTAAMRRL